MAVTTRGLPAEAGSHGVDVQAFIDAHPVSPLQKRLLFLCFVVIAIDAIHGDENDLSFMQELRDQRLHPTSRCVEVSPYLKVFDRGFGECLTQF